ncbi:Uncharacterized protein DAT39_008979, partial [Clarias magur]
MATLRRSPKQTFAPLSSSLHSGFSRRSDYSQVPPSHELLMYGVQARRSENPPCGDPRL